MNQEEYLKNRVEDQIAWYDAKSQWNQKCFKRLQVFQLVAAATIPFLTGYISEGGFWIRLIIGIEGILIAGAGAINGLYKFQENWLEYRTTCESLRHEKYLFLTLTEPYNVDKPFPLFVHRVEASISKENTNWANYVKKQPNKKIIAHNTAVDREND